MEVTAMSDIKSIIETMFNEAKDEGEKKCPNCGKNPCVCKDNKDEGCCGRRGVLVVGKATL
jgi:hypothetical protein